MYATMVFKVKQRETSLRTDFYIASLVRRTTDDPIKLHLHARCKRRIALAEKLLLYDMNPYYQLSRGESDETILNLR